MMTHNLNPTLLSLGPIEVRWYGLMYVIGFVIGGLLLRKLSREKFFPVPEDKVDNFVTANMLGMLFGARLLYVFVYNWPHYQKYPEEIIQVWKGGLSFHGAILGFVVATLIYAQKNKHSFFSLTDCIALAGTQGLFFGRMGNFINGGLFGRITDVPWAVIFPEGGPYPRHPSQIYEGALEGIVLFAILWLIKPYAKWRGLLSSVFLIGYGSFRFIVEYFREPDSQLGYFFMSLTMGQILCSLMIFIGLAMLYLTQFSPRIRKPVSL